MEQTCRWELAELYEQHSAALWRQVVRMTGDTAVAEDIVQETLLRAWRKRSSLDTDPAGLRPWLFRVAHNLVVDDVRSARHRHESVAAALPERATADRSDALFDAMVIESALAELSVDHRAAVVLAYYGGRTVPEIARELDVAPGTVKSRLHYGLRALRLALQEKGVTR